MEFPLDVDFREEARWKVLSLLAGMIATMSLPLFSADRFPPNWKRGPDGGTGRYSHRGCHQAGSPVSTRARRQLPSAMTCRRFWC